MHSAASAPVPAQDEKTDAVLLYSERTISVQSVDKVKTHVRIAYKILRPGGREYGIAYVSFNSHSKITGLRGWCIPSQGKDYEVKDKDGIEIAVPKVEGSELISDVRAKVIQIPAADPGNVVGYEYDEEEQPMVLQDVWSFQREIPVREMHYSLQLPPGWAYKASWINYPETKPMESGTQLQWALSDIKSIRAETEMPPLPGGIHGSVLFPPGRRFDPRFCHMAGDGHVVSQPDQQPPRCFSADHAAGRNVDRICQNSAR